jgi:hypothetical protein
MVLYLFPPKTISDALVIIVKLCHTLNPVTPKAPLLQIFAALGMLVAAIPKPAGDESDANDDVYSFTKRLCQLLAIIGSRQLTPLWGLPGLSKDPPAHFDQYLQVLLAFTAHKSLLLSSFTLPVWLNLLNHADVAKTPQLQVCLEPLLRISFERSVRHGARLPTVGYTRGCHWFPRLLASSSCKRVSNVIPLSVHSSYRLAL